VGRPRNQRQSTSKAPQRGAGSRGSAAPRGVSVTSPSPVGNISGSRPTVQATVRSGQGTLSKSDIHVHLDGEPVREFQYRRTTGSLSFTPRKLASGAHTVEVSVSPQGGGGARKSWSFVVK
jgi:hypothetical protein